MLPTNIDYVATNFEYPTLAKIHGKPTYKTLQEVKNQIKANSTTVTNYLDGGDNGHLGLVCTVAEHMNINATAYITPGQRNYKTTQRSYQCTKSVLGVNRLTKNSHKTDLTGYRAKVSKRPPPLYNGYYSC